jgi:hypothetical protein
MYKLLSVLTLAGLFGIAILATPITDRLFGFLSPRRRGLVANILFAAAAVTASLLFPMVAFADDGITAALPSTDINLGNIILTLSGIAAAVLASAAHFGVRALTKFLTAKTGIDLDNVTRSYLDPAIDKAISYATVQVQKAAANNLKIDVHNETIAHATNYLIDRVPDALAHFGLDQEHLEQLIEARLGKFLGVQATATGTGTAATSAATSSVGA